MTAGRTSDLRVYLGRSGGLAEIDGLLGLTIGGEATVSREPFLGEAWTEASVHAAGHTVALSTLVSTPGLDSALTDLLTAGGDLKAGTSLVVVDASGRLPMWRALPVEAVAPGWTAPDADAITRTWPLVVSGRASWGTVVRSRTTTTTLANALAGNAAAGSRVHVLVTSPSGVTSVKVGSAAEESIGSSKTLRSFEMPSQAGQVQVKSATAGADVLVLVGSDQSLPEG